MIATAGFADILDSALDLVRPLELLSPSEFAEAHREVRFGPIPGKWRNDSAPYLVGVMNAIQECVDRGLDGVVNMKSAQGGGTEGLGITGLCWLQTYYPGPYLYLTTTDKAAEQLSRDRWDSVLQTCEPLRKKHLRGKSHGEQVKIKRFIDGKFKFSGAVSPNNYISDPYRGFIFDEIDNALDELPDGADPIATLMQRLTAFRVAGPTIGIAYAHPTERTRGAGLLYYTQSDQRRGHVECPHCHTWIAPRWEHVTAIAAPGELQAVADRDSSRYVYVAPCCGVTWSEPDRLRAISRVEQRSTLPPEEAAKKRWIGVHFWQFFYLQMSVVDLAKVYVEALDDPGKMRAFVNKVLGDVFDLDPDESADEDAWRACVTIARHDGDAASYFRGEVPPEVSILTGGTDENSESLHWTVWGWGLLQVLGGGRVRCGWLIDWGEIKREGSPKTLDAADLLPFEQALYSRVWTTKDGRSLSLLQVGHDTGWLPDGVYEFADARAPRGVPIKGGNDDVRSKNPLLRWGKKAKRFVKGFEIPWRDERLGIVNTFLAKRQFFGLVRRRFPLVVAPGVVEPERCRLHLPVDVEDAFLDHVTAETLVRRGKSVVWHRDPAKPNHWSDCSIYAFVLGEQAEKAHRGQTSQEIRARAAQARAEAPQQIDKAARRPQWKIGR